MIQNRKTCLANICRINVCLLESSQKLLFSLLRRWFGLGLQKNSDFDNFRDYNKKRESGCCFFGGKKIWQRLFFSSPGWEFIDNWQPWRNVVTSSVVKSVIGGFIGVNSGRFFAAAWFVCDHKKLQSRHSFNAVSFRGKEIFIPELLLSARKARSCCGWLLFCSTSLEFVLCSASHNDFA